MLNSSNKNNRGLSLLVNLHEPTPILTSFFFLLITPPIFILSDAVTHYIAPLLLVSFHRSTIVVSDEALSALLA